MGRVPIFLPEGLTNEIGHWNALIISHAKIAATLSRRRNCGNLGSKFYAKVGQERHQHTYIRQKLWEVARLLDTIRNKDHSVIWLKDCLTPVKFQPVVDSVKSTEFEFCERHRIQARALIKEMCKVYEGRSFNATGRDCQKIQETFEMDGRINQVYSGVSTTHGHITDCKLLVCMYWTRPPPHGSAVMSQPRPLF